MGNAALIIAFALTKSMAVLKVGLVALALVCLYHGILKHGDSDDYDDDADDTGDVVYRPAEHFFAKLKRHLDELDPLHAR